MGLKPFWIKKNNTVHKVGGVAIPAHYPASKITYDNTDSGLVATDAQDAIDELNDAIDEINDTSVTPVSGNPISISDLKSNQLAIDPVITFEPIQAGSGTPSPSNVRAISGYDKIEVLSCGKNIASFLNNNIYVNSGTTKVSATNNSIKYTASGSYARIGFSFRVLPNTSYTVSFVGKMSGSSQTCYLGDTTEGSSSTYTSFSISSESLISYEKIITTDTSNVLTVLFYINNAASQSGELEINNFQIEENNEATAFEPYVSLTQISESLGQTVYGGTLDVRTGKFTGDYTEYIFTGNETWVSTFGGQAYSCSCLISKPSISNVAQTNVYKCEIAEPKTANDLNASQTGIAANGISIFISANLYTSISSFTGKKVIYKLAAPFTIQLTPHEISLLKDYAYVSTNGTNMSFSYHNGENASLADVSQLGETVNDLLNNQTAIINVSQDISYLAKEHYLKIGNIINLSCEATGTFTNGSYTNIGTIVYKPTNNMWFPLINAVSGALAGTVLLTSEGLIRALPSANGLTKVAINLMFIAN